MEIAPNTTKSAKWIYYGLNTSVDETTKVIMIRNIIKWTESMDKMLVGKDLDEEVAGVFKETTMASTSFQQMCLNKESIYKNNNDNIVHATDLYNHSLTLETFERNEFAPVIKTLQKYSIKGKEVDDKWNFDFSDVDGLPLIDQADYYTKLSSFVVHFKEGNYFLKQQETKQKVQEIKKLEKQAALWNAKAIELKEELAGRGRQAGPKDPESGGKGCMTKQGDNVILSPRPEDNVTSPPVIEDNDLQIDNIVPETNADKSDSEDDTESLSAGRAAKKAKVDKVDKAETKSDKKKGGSSRKTSSKK